MRSAEGRDASRPWVPDLLNDEASDAGALVQSSWYATRGYAIRFESRLSACEVENFRFVSTTVSDVAGYLPRAPRVASVPVADFASGVLDTNDSDDVDCPDFESQTEAQAAFEASGGINIDPFRLDADNDGIACEESSGFGSPFKPEPTPKPESMPEPEPVPSGTTLANLTSTATGDVNFSDFTSQPQAQRFFDATNSGDDPFGLDRYNDGVAYESRPG